MSDLQDERLAELGQQCFDFLQTDLDLCNTFIDLANTRLVIGYRAGAERALAHAEKGLAAMTNLVDQLRNDQLKTEILQGLQELRSRINNLACRLL